MKTVDLIDAVRRTGDIDKKLEHIVTALSTQQVANTNALLAILTTLKHTPGIDTEALKKDLEERASTPLQSNDVIPQLYSQIMGVMASTL